VTDALPVELAVVPLSVVVTSLKLPVCGVTRTLTSALGGMLDADKATGTWPVGAVGKVTSGVAVFPVGVGGTLRPPTDVIRSVGVVGVVTGPGVGAIEPLAWP